MPPFDTPVGIELTNYILGGLGGLSSWIAEHDTPEYCRRLRAGIPLAFPFTDIDPDFPEIPTIDDVNRQLNERDGVVWRISGSGGPSRPPVFVFADPCSVAPGPRPPALSVVMQTALPTVGAQVNPPGTNQGWSQPGRITAKDGLATTTGLLATGAPGLPQSWRLQGSSFAWIDLPDAAPVVGIEVHIHCRSISNAGGNVQDMEVQLLQGGIFGGDNKAVLGVNWPGDQVFRTQVFGADNDTWGRDWTGADLKAGFAVSFRVKTTAAALSVAEVDWIEVTAWYLV
jgi:hypothetical protein